MFFANVKHNLMSNWVSSVVLHVTIQFVVVTQTCHAGFTGESPYTLTHKARTISFARAAVQTRTAPTHV